MNKTSVFKALKRIADKNTTIYEVGDKVLVCDHGQYTLGIIILTEPTTREYIIGCNGKLVSRYASVVEFDNDPMYARQRLR